MSSARKYEPLPRSICFAHLLSDIFARSSWHNWFRPWVNSSFQISSQIRTRIEVWADLVILIDSGSWFWLYFCVELTVCLGMSCWKVNLCASLKPLADSSDQRTFFPQICWVFWQTHIAVFFSEQSFMKPSLSRLDFIKETQRISETQKYWESRIQLSCELLLPSELSISSAPSKLPLRSWLLLWLMIDTFPEHRPRLVSTAHVAFVIWYFSMSSNKIWDHPWICAYYVTSDGNWLHPN